MGDNAEMILEGYLDPITGEYTGGDDYGHFRKRTFHNPSYGVYSWGRVNKFSDEKTRRLVNQYCTEKYPMLTYRCTNPKKLFKEQCEIVITKEFKQFKEWVSNTKWNYFKQ